MNFVDLTNDVLVICVNNDYNHGQENKYENDADNSKSASTVSTESAERCRELVGGALSPVNHKELYQG